MKSDPFEIVFRAFFNLDQNYSILSMKYSMGRQ